MIAPGPVPVTKLDEALRSTRSRLRRDVELAAWCGLTRDELDPFLDRLAMFDARRVAHEAKRARDEARRMAAERERVERWGHEDGSRYGLAALARSLAELGNHPTPSEHITRVAYSLGRLVAGGELTASVVGRSLRMAMERLCLPEDVYDRKVERAFARGLRSPRSAPVRAAA